MEKRKRPTVGEVRQLEAAIAKLVEEKDALVCRNAVLKSELAKEKEKYKEMHDAWVAMIAENSRLMERNLVDRILNR